MKVEIKDAQAKLVLDTVLGKVADLTPAMRSAAQHMKKSIIENFQAGGRPNKWKPLSPQYAAWKSKHGYTSQILVLTHRLMQSFNTEANAKQARVFTGVQYGKYHNFGTSKMPKRPFLLFQTEDRTVIAKIFKDFIGGTS